jgi:hypothetical protein
MFLGCTPHPENLDPTPKTYTLNTEQSMGFTPRP